MVKTTLKRLNPSTAAPAPDLQQLTGLGLKNWSAGIRACEVESDGNRLTTCRVHEEVAHLPSLAARQGLPLTLAHDEARGRFLVAARDIKSGEVVLKCPPYLTALLRSHRKRVCHACLRGSSSGRLTISCSGCGLAHYCSHACREAHAAGAAVALAAGDDAAAAGSSELGSACGVEQWTVVSVPHVAVCGVLRRFSGSFKYDADMEAILAMCLEALACEQLTQQQQQGGQLQPQQQGGRWQQGCQQQQGDQLRGHMAPPASETGTLDAGTASSQVPGSSTGAACAQSAPAAAANDPQMQQVGQGTVVRQHTMADFLNLQSHMDEVQGRDRQEWAKGVQLLLAAMQKEGWPGLLPSESELLHLCGRILSNNFGVWAAQTLAPSPDAAAASSTDTGSTQAAAETPLMQGTQQTQAAAHSGRETQTSEPRQAQDEELRAAKGTHQQEGIEYWLQGCALNETGQQPDERPAVDYDITSNSTDAAAVASVFSGRQQHPSQSASEHQLQAPDQATSLAPIQAPPQVPVQDQAQPSGQDAAAAAAAAAAVQGGESKAPGSGWTRAMVGRQLYIAASYFNHSCSPNCVVEPTGSWAVVRAAEDIHAGTEAAISYIDVDAPVSARRAELRRSFFFTCDCPRCRAGEGAAQVSWAHSRAQAQHKPKLVHARERNKGGGHKGGGVSRRQQSKKQGKSS